MKTAEKRMLCLVFVPRPASDIMDESFVFELIELVDDVLDCEWVPLPYCLLLTASGAKPTAFLSRSKTLYTFFKKTSPSNI